MDTQNNLKTKISWHRPFKLLSWGRKSKWQQGCHVNCSVTNNTKSRDHLFEVKLNTSTRTNFDSPLWVCSSRRCNHRRSLVGRTSFYANIPLSSLNKLKTKILKLYRGLTRWLAGFESSPAPHPGKSMVEKRNLTDFNHISSMKI